eukprot:Colp12_sorted_trinity150504_noHs@24000
MSVNESIFYLLTNRTVVLVLAFVGGFIDSAGYMKLFGLFTSSITGNLVVACATGFREGDGVWARVAVTLAFMVGAFVTTLFYLRLKHKLKVNQWDIGIVLFSCEAIALAVAGAIGIYLNHTSAGYGHIDSWETILEGALLALSMGIHNAAAQDVIPSCPSTTVMTMTMVKTSMLAANAVQYFLASKGLGVYDHVELAVVLDKLQTARTKFCDHVVQILCFAAGAVVGAVLALHVQFWSLGLPLVMILAVVSSIQAAKAQHFRDLNKHELPEASKSLELALSGDCIDEDVLAEEEQGSIPDIEGIV